MLGRAVTANDAILPAVGQIRHGANLKTVKMRMRSVGNIQKITKAMKMVSAAKLRHDMRRLEVGLPFAKPVISLFDRIPRDEASTKPLSIFLMVGDKGLCGSANSAPLKVTREKIKKEVAAGREIDVMILGNKGPGALQRLFGNKFTTTFDEHLKNPWNFGTACAIADRINTKEPEMANLIHNHYISIVAFDTDILHLVTKKEVAEVEKGEWSKAMDPYSFEPGREEIWNDLHEFYYGCMVFGNYLDSLAAEQSTRMGAMANASKNAGELLEKLSILYNRTRQAKITTELCEIISGASAV